MVDSDGDGFGDGVEVRSGTDPLDPGDYPVKEVGAAEEAISVYRFVLAILGISTIVSLGILIFIIRRRPSVSSSSS